MVDLSGIDPTLGSTIIELGTALSTLVLKGTTTAIQGKISSLKNEKNVDTVRGAYVVLIMKWLTSYWRNVRRHL